MSNKAATATQTKETPNEDIEHAGPLDDLGSLPAELIRLVKDQLQLAALELRLAGRSLTAMITAAVFLGALFLLVWIALLASTGLGLVAIGLPPAVVMLVLAVLSLALAWLLRVYIRRKSADLGFPGTLRSLSPAAENARAPDLH